jgi:hypothetical protein
MQKLWARLNLFFLLLGLPIALLFSFQSQNLISMDNGNNLKNISPDFVENLGQFYDIVKYSLCFSNGQIFLTPQEIVIHSFSKTGGKKGVIHNNRLRFVGSNPQTEIKGILRRKSTFNYFRGNDPKQWIKGAKTFESVLYEDIYPNINLVLDGEDGLETLEFHIKPGGDAHNIQLKYNGKKVGLEKINLSQSENILKFPIRKIFKNSNPALDPVLNYSTFLGGSDAEEAWVIAVDSFGCAYVAGETYVRNYPTTPGAYDTDFSGGGDIFVSKLDPTGSNLLYSTFIGGSADDPEGMEGADGIAIDGSGNVFLTGWTSATDFPTTATAFDRSFNGGGHEYFTDAFVTKLDASGSNLLYSTYLGGNRDEWGNAITVDTEGYAYVVGVTYSANFPTTPGVIDSSHNGGIGDAFVTKMDLTGSSLLYSTFIGGKQWDEGSSIVLDSARNAYISGHTESENFPVTPGAFDTSYSGSQDGYVSKLNPSGSILLFSTYLGGNKEDSCDSDGGDGIALDRSGNIYVVGETESANFPTTPGAFDRTHNGRWDAFVAALSSTGSTLLYSTFLGGSGDEQGNGIALDDSGGVFLVGDTDSSDFPTTAAAPAADLNGRQDVFVAKLISSVSRLAFSTFLGGNKDDESDGMALDDSGGVYVTGWTKSTNFPTTPFAFDTSYNGAQDVFVTKISVDSISISGFVKTAFGDGIENVMLSFSNGGGESSTDSEGYYSHSVAYGWSGTVTPIKLNYYFSPASKDYSGLDANMINQDFSGITDVFSNLAPLNFSGIQHENRSLSQVEHINILEWQDNPNHIDIAKYRIYYQDGDRLILLVELDAVTSRYFHRKVNKDISYNYALVAVNSEGKESLPAYTEIL